MRMKKFIRLVGAVVFLSSIFGCAERLQPGLDDGPEESRPVIFRFGTSAPTRTAYREGSWSDVQPIDWVDGDRIRVYSPQASLPYGSLAVHWADYIVSPKDDRSRGTASPVGGTGLSWVASNRHAFYGVYPAPGGNSPAAEASALAGRFTFTLPATQTHGDQMGYAYLVAFTETEQVSGTVELPFHAAYTAYDISIDGNGADRFMLNELSLETADPDGCPLSGTYTVRAGAGGPSVVSFGETTGKVTVTFPGEGVELVAGHPVRILVLAAPSAATGVTLSTVRTWNGIRASHALPLKRTDGAWHSFAPFTYNRIDGVVTPEQTKLITVNSYTTAWNPQGSGRTEVIP